MPDHSTIWRFRQQLAEDGWIEALFKEINDQLSQKGLFIKEGSVSIIDISVIEAKQCRPHKNKHLCFDETALPAPVLQIEVVGQQATALWNTVELAQSYQLYYAPYSDPLSKITLDHIRSFSIGQNTYYSTQLPKNSQYYVAIRAYQGNCHSFYSNLEPVLIRED